MELHEKYLIEAKDNKELYADMIKKWNTIQREVNKKFAKLLASKKNNPSDKDVVYFTDLLSKFRGYEKTIK